MSLMPLYLKSGDLVLIIATARARAEEVVQPAVALLEKWGLRVEIGPNAYKKHHQFAGTDEERASDLQWAIQHPEAKAVLFSGGGYGTLRIIDRVNFSPLKQFPKWFAGYSDATVIFSRLAKINVPCIHGTMAFQFLKNEEATASLKKLLFGETIEYNVPAHPLNREGKAQGFLCGGNLSILYALSGSHDDLQTEGKILFIEDLDEQLYHIDRMMHQMKRSGKLAKLAGFVVGGMSEMKDNTVPYGQTVQEIIYDAVKEYEYPLCFDFPAGHIEKNMALYLNSRTEFNVSNAGAHLRFN
jgi:muramoyltetrapeptide carboxypeptidase